VLVIVFESPHYFFQLDRAFGSAVVGVRADPIPSRCLLVIASGRLCHQWDGPATIVRYCWALRSGWAGPRWAAADADADADR
jgi:hypothetical protein